LESKPGGSGMLAVVDDASVSRCRAGFEEHQPEPCFLDPAYPAGIDPVATGLAIDDAAERPLRQPRHPGDAAAEPRQHATDVELAAADADLELPCLVEPLHTGRRQPQ